MLRHFSPTATNSEYWSYTAGAMAEFLQDAIDSATKTLRWALLPINVYREALALFASAIAVPSGENAGNKVGNMANYKMATDALRASRPMPSTVRSEIDASLKRFEELLTRLHDHEMIAPDELNDVEQLKAFFEQLASDGDRTAYADALQFEPTRPQFFGRR